MHYGQNLKFSDKSIEKRRCYGSSYGVSIGYPEHAMTLTSFDVDNVMTMSYHRISTRN